MDYFIAISGGLLACICAHQPILCTPENEFTKQIESSERIIVSFLLDVNVNAGCGAQLQNEENS